MPGTPGVAWGDWSHFLTYVGRLNWFLPPSLISIVGAIATLAETVLAFLLLINAWPRYTALASGALLLLFALTMTFALGIKAPLGYSVYVGATAAFYLAATTIGGYAWEKTGRIWYDTLLKLTVNSSFQDAANTTYHVAGTKFGTAESKAVRDAWGAVGIKVS